MTDLLSRAARVEAATGADIQLDADIRDALGLPHDYSVEWRGWGFDEAGDPIEKPKAFPYTASLDAAMTLVPKGHTLFHLCGPYSDNQSRATVAGGRPVRFYETTAATPALALTAASLRALAAQHEGEGDHA